MKELVNKIVAKYLVYRYSKIEKFINDPIGTQNDIFNYLIENGKKTKWGAEFNFKDIKTYSDFNKLVPVSVYDELKPWINRMLNGERDVLWPGFIDMFSKSSGTTEDKSKFIPTSEENLANCHLKGGWDAASILYKNKPETKLFSNKNLILGGSLQSLAENPQIRVGDISALMMTNMPFIGRAFHTPDIKTALLPDWNEKIPLMVKIASKENVSSFGGVPSWLLVLLKEVVKVENKHNLLEVWPELQVYFHGGVSFAPYKKQFQELIPTENFTYINVYNSSEGYFAIQDDLASDNEDMLLLLNSQIFYEFIPFSQYGNDNYDIFPIHEVEKGVNYVMVISTNSGMWRYVVGDTVEFTTLDPYRIKITGRTKQFINVFGEEVMVSNTDKALNTILSKHKALIGEYTVAPIYIDGTHKGGHQWLIEFEKEPENLLEFKRELDRTLQSINSDYEAKRYNDYVLQELELISLPRGTFYKWMESRGKLGGQNKVPRLSNSRKYVDVLLEIANIL